VGSNNDPADAVQQIRQYAPDLLFLDIHMPGLSGFELLDELQEQPLVIFTTAYDRYALDAFSVNSIDYLLKPITSEDLERSLDKAERMRRLGNRPVEFRELFSHISAPLGFGKKPWLARIASRSGDKIEPIDLHCVTHFFSKDKLTFAATPERSYVVDATIAKLEQELDPGRFVRINRGIILNLDHLFDLRSLFGGRMVARIRGSNKTELPVSRDRVGILKKRMGLL
jgi:DNA-binding LytR/AlgR family response regulator